MSPIWKHFFRVNLMVDQYKIITLVFGVIIQPCMGRGDYIKMPVGTSNNRWPKSCVGFINPGSLRDRLPRQGSTRESKNNRAKGRSSNRLEGLAQEEQRPLVSYFGPPIRPERSIRAPAASRRPLRSEGLLRALLPTPTLRLSDRGT